MSEIYLLIGLLAVCFVVVGVALRSIAKTLNDLSQRVAGLESASGERMAEISRVLADPDKIDAELEKSANLTEMRRAKRRHLPRPDAGPPARVSKLKIFRA